MNEELKEYYNILSKEIPNFLYEYINTKEMQKQAGISVSCGTIYSKLFNEAWYSSLDHSIAVALVVWNFTKDKKQTLAGLFHDIATPVFKHAIDFMNGDYEKQESTEELTGKIISESKEIMSLLNRDKIKLEEVQDYHIYPIADNDTPLLSADRLEYTLSNGLGAAQKFWELDDVKEVYQNIEILQNEEGIPELGFKDKKTAEKFVHTMSKLSVRYRENRVKYSMQLLADIMKSMKKENLITVDDLYKYSEKEIIERIEKSRYKDIFKKWQDATEILESDEDIRGVYTVSVKAKKRYIIPLVKENGKTVRIDTISETARKDIERAKNFETRKYAYLNFDFPVNVQ